MKCLISSDVHYFQSIEIQGNIISLDLTGNFNNNPIVKKLSSKLSVTINNNQKHSRNNE